VSIPFPIPGFDLVGTLMSALSRAVSSGVQTLGSWAFDHMTSALLATTRVHLDGWFSGPWQAMLTVAGMLALPILLAGVATEVLAGRPGQALRRGVLMPLAVGPALLAARAVLGLAMAAVDAACATVVQLGIGGPGGYAHALDRMRETLGISASPATTGLQSGLALIVIVLIAAVLAFIIWIELAARAALIYLLAAFVPLALAGLFWSATARWTRRIIEVLAAVILAQLVITVLMVLAAAAFSHPARGLASDVDAIAVGLALLLLGSIALPLTFRVVPHVAEAAVAAGAGATVAGRMHRGGARLLAAAPSPVARLAGAGAARPHHGSGGGPAPGPGTGIGPPPGPGTGSGPPPGPGIGSGPTRGSGAGSGPSPGPGAGSGPSPGPGTGSGPPPGPGTGGGPTRGSSAGSGSSPGASAAGAGAKQSAGPGPGGGPQPSARRPIAQGSGEDAAAVRRARRSGSGRPGGAR
jgi:hypothetical protein